MLLVWGLQPQGLILHLPAGASAPASSVFEALTLWRRVATVTYFAVTLTLVAEISFAES